MARYFVFLYMLLLANTFAFSKKKADLKPRLVVLTDIAPGDLEPDDMESMVRLMAYADLYEIEALITTTGWNCDPYPKEWADSLYRVVEAYEKDVKKLMKRSGQKLFLPIDKEQGKQNIGYSIVGGHPHCQLPLSQYSEVEAFVDKFFLGKEDIDTNVTKANIKSQLC